jgi:lipopolysaccharide export system protein LptA
MTSLRAGIALPLLLALALAPVALAQDPQSALGERDTSLPIEITADSLEVQRDEQVATFRGNVDAVQGDLVLNADTLRVFYTQQDRAEAAGPSGIRRIEAEGNVLLSSPEETAQGDRGVFHVDRDFIELFGGVVLTRGQNVIRGRKLELNLATGFSKIVGETAVAQQQQAGGGKQRVQAVFYPESRDEGREGEQQ